MQGVLPPFDQWGSLKLDLMECKQETFGVMKNKKRLSVVISQIESRPCRFPVSLSRLVKQDRRPQGSMAELVTSVDQKHGKPEEGMECACCMDDIDQTNYVEYRSGEGATL